MCELAKGTCGTCVWEIDIKGTLTIRPADGKNGKLDSFDCITLFPWHVHSRTIRKTVIEDGVKAERSICGIFRNMTLCREFDIGRLDISDTEDIGYVFQNCTSVESIPSIARWDTGKVQEIEFMFYGCSSLRDISFARENRKSRRHDAYVQQMRCAFGHFAACELGHEKRYRHVLDVFRLYGTQERGRCQELECRLDGRMQRDVPGYGRYRKSF